jgi:DNA-binding MarR family transcriptional regulator
MATLEMEKSEKPMLAGLRGVITAAREVDPEMPAQTLLALLEVANEPGMTMKDLQEKLGLSSAATSRVISRLSEWEKHGVAGLNYIDRRHNPHDRRYQIVSLTPKGMSFIRKLLKASTQRV